MRKSLVKALSVVIASVMVSSTFVLPVNALSVKPPMNQSSLDSLHSGTETVTAYTSKTVADRTASGEYPYEGSCAVHPKSAGTLTPIVAFGTTAFTDDSMPMYSGDSRSAFIVNDVGDTNYRNYNNGKLTKYWIDVWQELVDLEPIYITGV